MRQGHAFILSVLTVFGAGVSAASTASIATPNAGDDRRLARVAHAIWPDVPVARVRAWARAEAPSSGLYVHPPAQRAARLIRAELAARAEGANPDGERLDQMLATIFEVARQAGVEPPTTPLGRKMGRQLHALRFQLVGAGTAATGACAQLFGHTPLYTGMILGGLTLSAATISYIVANLAFDSVPELPGQRSWGERSKLLSAMDEYSKTLAAELRRSPEWDRAFPNVAPEPACDDFKTLLRSVWTPGDLRRAAVHRFGRAP